MKTIRFPRTGIIAATAVLAWGTVLNGGTVLTGGVVPVGGSAAASPVQAVRSSQAPGTPSADQVALAGRLADRLGPRSAGGYLDGAGKAVVTVTSAADAATVRSAGATPRMVERSGAQLAGVTGTLRRELTLSGTGWAVDPVAAKVVVWADSTVKGSRLRTFEAVTAGLGAAVRVERVRGRLMPHLAGGDFNVRSGGTYYALTAGHCTNATTTWTTANGTVVGSTVASSYPGNDFGLIKYKDPKLAEGVVNLHTGAKQDITAAGTPVVGQPVRRSSPVTGLRTGTVTALNATVNYGDGTVTGLIRTTLCSEAGESGSPLFNGSIAYGMLSGGSGNCSSGGITFFQPVVEALNAYGVSVF
jgi:streptogrisin D